MKCEKCGGEIDTSIVYTSYPPQYKCKVCGAFTRDMSVLSPDSTISDIHPNLSSMCKCCNGRGIQQNKDGINIRCPECDGTGYWSVFKNSNDRLLNGDWTCRKDKKLTDYKIGDDLNAPKVGDFPEQLNEIIC